MKLVFFDDFKFGAMKGDSVVDLSDLVKDIPAVSPQDTLSGVIANWDSLKSKLEAAVEQGSGTPVGQVRLRSPLPRPLTHSCMASFWGSAISSAVTSQGPIGANVSRDFIW